MLMLLRCHHYRRSYRNATSTAAAVTIGRFNIAHPGIVNNIIPAAAAAATDAVIFSVKINIGCYYNLIYIWI